MEIQLEKDIGQSIIEKLNNSCSIENKKRGTKNGANISNTKE